MLRAHVFNGRSLAMGVAFLSAIGTPRAASAAVSQPAPDSTPLPQPVPGAETGLVTARGFSESSVTLGGLFAFRNDTVDPSADASADPGTFRPRCPGSVTAEFVLHGGGCNLALAWYNATGSAPAAGDLHALVPADVASEMACMMDFCPLAGSSMLPNTSWMPRIYTSDLCGDAAYAGGAVGFALVGDAGTQCSQTKYTERAANVTCAACTPSATWVTALVYASRARADAYYLAFEDLPMTPESWDGGADGDFNDFVYHVTGVCHGSCDGGGAGGSGGTSATGGASGSATGGSAEGGTSSGTDAGGATSSGGSGEPSGGSGAASGTDGGGAASGTGGDATIPCVPGRQLACSCPDGSEGSQRCDPSGMVFEPCICAPSRPRDEIDTEGSCGCRHGGRPRGGAASLGLLLVLALRRRARHGGAR